MVGLCNPLLTIFYSETSLIRTLKGQENSALNKGMSLIDEEDRCGEVTVGCCDVMVSVPDSHTGNPSSISVR